MREKKDKTVARRWWLIAIALGSWALLSEPANAQTYITYETQDGWRIDGSLFLPKTLPPTPIPAVILLTEPGWIDRTTFSGYLATHLAELNIAVLAIDFRGMGSSLAKKDFVVFSEDDMEGLRIDIQGALKFLGTQKGIDASNVALLGTGISSHYAALEAAHNPSVKALVTLSAIMREESIQAIASRPDLPVLSIVGRENKTRFQSAADSFASSKSSRSDFIVARGHGTSMFSHTPGLEEKVVKWLEGNIKTLGSEVEITFKAEDGWPLVGTLRIPGGIRPGTKVPGVVMVHGAKHDQQTYYELSQSLAREGIATFRFDWRGKGRSIVEGKGLYGINMDGAESENVYKDARAAIQVLASQAQVDSNRIGIIAATAGTGNALRAAYNDGRIQTAVLLTSNAAPTGEAKEFIASGKPIFAIASTEDINYNRGSLAEETRLAFTFSPNKDSELLLYADAGRGSEMLKSKPEIERMVLRWFVEKLGASKAPLQEEKTISQELR